MVVGAALLLIALGRTHRRRRAEARLVTPTARSRLSSWSIFLGLLAAGMAIPFAIGVPAIVYLLLHGGVPALRASG